VAFAGMQTQPQADAQVSAAVPGQAATVQEGPLDGDED